MGRYQPSGLKSVEDGPVLNAFLFVFLFFSLVVFNFAELQPFIKNSKGSQHIAPPVGGIS